MFDYLMGRKAPEPEEALSEIREMIEGTDIAESLRAGGEAGVGNGVEPTLDKDYLVLFSVP
jgi:hypothetical protein